MALFAAYADSSEQNSEPKEDKQEWLTNSSYKIDVVPNTEPLTSAKLHSKHLEDGNYEIILSNDEEDTSKAKKKKSKKKKSKYKKLKKSSKEEVQCHPNEYIIDKSRVTEYQNVQTIARPAVPKYHLRLFLGDRLNRKRKNMFKRYFDVIIDKHVNESNSENEEEITKKDLTKLVVKNIDIDFNGFQQEEEMSKTTAYFNRTLADWPQNIELWTEYINFQDSVFQFEKTHRKGSIAKGLRVTAERKLSILDKALTYNPDCEELLRMRLNIAVSVYPADELQLQLGKLVEKEQANIIYWQGYIEATQCSMSHCTTPAVLNLYIKCLHTLHTLRRTAMLDKALLEENILRMLYQCGLFLKQTGLFEQLWTLLRLYLELNLSPSNESKFNLSVVFNEHQLVELEEVILNSQLPIHELWLRVEKLREASHWLPFNGTECEDPQRLVFSEDVSELIHPITMQGNTFKLTVTILTLLKLPLLPTRHTTMQEFGIDYVPWSLDSIETLLAIFLPQYPIDLTNKFLLKYIQKLAIGPQYLKTLPGQEEFLQFILTTMRSCIDCLSGEEKTAVSIWWFRFQRLLIVLEKQGLFSITTTFKKKLKSDVKNLLKENTTNVILFKEYGLVEFESGNFSSAVNVLKTAIGMSNKNENEKAAVTSTFRTLIELHLNKNSESNIQDCLRYYIAFTQGKQLDNAPKIITQGALKDTNEILITKTNSFLDSFNINKIQGVQHFLPDLTTDWIICHGWFLYLNESMNEVQKFIQETLDKLEELTSEKLWQKEVLYEFLVAVLYKECIGKPGSGLFPKLDAALLKSIELYPNNLFLLSALAQVQRLHFCLGQPWWKMKSLLLKTGHTLPNLFLILIANQRISDIEEEWIDTVTGDVMIPDDSFRNKMLSLFKRLTQSDMCTRRCGLVWRLYLQFLHGHYDPKTCRNTYYTAVEECPWLKALYVDAAIYIPEELSQIQDLIIEKQLRIHVTPEELDVLRN